MINNENNIEQGKNPSRIYLICRGYGGGGYDREFDREFDRPPPSRSSGMFIISRLSVAYSSYSTETTAPE